MADTVLVKPRPGLILAGVPSTGIELPRALAEEWLADRMVVRVAVPTPIEGPPAGPQPAAKAATTRRRKRG